ncbi:MAG: hypothetical protein HFJ05_06200 [Eubacterium sp.]|nr:hypothetical protein [Eubacterium sp.]
MNKKLFLQAPEREEVFIKKTKKGSGKKEKHRRLLDAWKQECLKEYMTEEKFQIRFEW